MSAPKTNLKITALKVISHTNVLIKSLCLLQYLIRFLMDCLKKDAHLHLVSHEYHPYYLAQYQCDFLCKFELFQRNALFIG